MLRAEVMSYFDVNNTEFAGFAKVYQKTTGLLG
jgi:hypothetical protein